MWRYHLHVHRNLRPAQPSPAQPRTLHDHEDVRVDRQHRVARPLRRRGPVVVRLGMETKWSQWISFDVSIELATTVREDFTITEMALPPTRSFSWLKEPTSTF